MGRRAEARNREVAELGGRQRAHQFSGVAIRPGLPGASILVFVSPPSTPMARRRIVSSPDEEAPDEVPSSQQPEGRQGMRTRQGNANAHPGIIDLPGHNPDQPTRIPTPPAARRERNVANAKEKVRVQMEKEQSQRAAVKKAADIANLQDAEDEDAAQERRNPTPARPRVASSQAHSKDGKKSKENSAYGRTQNGLPMPAHAVTLSIGTSGSRSKHRVSEPPSKAVQSKTPPANLRKTGADAVFENDLEEFQTDELGERCANTHLTPLPH